jgi:hypothetical protein
MTDSLRQTASFTSRAWTGARDLGVVPRDFFPFVTKSHDRVRGPRDCCCEAAGKRLCKTLVILSRSIMAMLCVDAPTRDSASARYPPGVPAFTAPHPLVAPLVAITVGIIGFLSSR